MEEPTLLQHRVKVRFKTAERVLACWRNQPDRLASTSCQKGPAANEWLSAVAHFLPYTYLLTCILSLLFLWYIKYSTTYTSYVKIRPLVFASRANLKSHSDVPTSTICHLAPSHPTTDQQHSRAACLLHLELILHVSTDRTHRRRRRLARRIILRPPTPGAVIYCRGRDWGPHAIVSQTDSRSISGEGRMRPLIHNSCYQVLRLFPGR